MSCKLGKVNYVIESDAWRAAARCIERGILEDMQVYFCRPCLRWHLTTAKVQLNQDIWQHQGVVKKFQHRVKNWFNQRKTIDQWDND